MSFENWERFLHDTIEELNNDSSSKGRTNRERTRRVQRKGIEREKASGDYISTPTTSSTSLHTGRK